MSKLGLVVSGSLSEGLEVKLEGGAPVEDMAVGRYVTIEGKGRRFFGLITDVSLEAVDRRLALTPPQVSDPFIAEVVSGTSTFGIIKVSPQLSWDPAAETSPRPVKTVPGHFSPVRFATPEEVEFVFGREDERHFVVGNPLDMEARLCLDLKEFVLRSNGIFGKSGTGKTFLTRLLLIGILQKRAAVSLVFDMHNEYGWKGRREDGREVKGLKQLFPSLVAVFTLDEENSRRRGVSTDFVVSIGYDEIEPEDIAILKEALNLTDKAAEATYTLTRHFGQGRWLREFLALEGREPLRQLAEELGESYATLESLHRRLRTLQRFPFLTPEKKEDSVARLVSYLDRGIHVVLEFGRFTNDPAAYVLVANLLSRRLHDRYVERTEAAMGDKSQEPRHLVITIEEAHKFLNPQVSSQTIFGTIAREMRKYNVTLLVVDQRPSGIDEEVMSQLGTKAVYALDSEADQERVLAGVSRRGDLRRVLEGLEPRQQALLFGHALPMPAVVQTRPYGDSYSDFIRGKEEIEDLWPES